MRPSASAACGAGWLQRAAWAAAACLATAALAAASPPKLLAPAPARPLAATASSAAVVLDAPLGARRDETPSPPLRWRIKRPSAWNDSPAEPPVALAAHARTVSRADAPPSLRIRPASGASAASPDPFDDPFEDRLVTLTQAAPDADQAEASEPEQLAPPLFQPGALADRRDCREESRRCEDQRLLLQKTPLNSVSLDITPQFRPDTAMLFRRSGQKPTEDEAAEKRRKLAELGERRWTTRDGRVAAVGRLIDYVHGRVHVRTADGRIVRIPFGELSEADLCVLADAWNLPTECLLSDAPPTPRAWLASTMTWKASNLAHKPLYFEQVQLERYGHSAGPVLQPLLSGAHFFLNVAALPYKMGIHPPYECQYALGYYRPGDCAPWLLPPVPLSIRGGLLQAGVVTGGVFILP